MLYMKYDIDNELKSISAYSGSVVGRLYPMLNAAYRMQKCRSDDSVNVKEYKTEGYNGRIISTLVIEPKEYREKLPCIMFFHGGGFLMSASSAHYHIAKRYAACANCKVVMPDYRLMPKYRYPVAIEDCYNTYLWMTENADRLDIDKDRIIVTGDSAGGNIAAALVVMLKDRDRSLPKGAMLIYPVLDKRMVTGSMQRFTDTPIWDSRCSKMFWDMYLENTDEDKNRYASISEIDKLDYFPPTFIEVAEFDCLHDEGVEFAKRLMAADVNVQLHEVERACHGYESVFNSILVKNCMDRRIDWINRVFAQ